MHELGIVFYIIKDVKEAAAQNNCSKVASVTLDVGEVTSIVPYYLEDMWNWAVKKEGPILEDCKLNIETIKAVTYCENCKSEYPTVQYGKTCPHCGSGQTYLIKGSEVSIRNIEAC